MDPDMTYTYMCEVAAETRGDPPIARQFYEVAKLRILEGKEKDVEYFPGSETPTLRAVYKVAARLEREAATVN